MNAKELKSFVLNNVKPNLHKSFQIFGKRDLVRFRGAVVEGITFEIARAGFLRIHPIYYTFGANICDDFIHGVSLSLLDPERWTYSKDVVLDGGLTQRVIEYISNDLGHSVARALDDGAIENIFFYFANRVPGWTPDLFLAFHNMTKGAPSARTDLSRAFKQFEKYSRLNTNKPLRDWEKLLLDRFNVLKDRLDSPDCIALCRRDAESHAAALGFPEMQWPEEWPKQVAPWPKRGALPVTDRIKMLFRR